MKKDEIEKHVYIFILEKGKPVEAKAGHELTFLPAEGDKVRMVLDAAEVSDTISLCYWSRFGNPAFKRDIEQYLEHVARWEFSHSCICGRGMSIEHSENYNVAFKGGYERSNGFWSCPSISSAKHEIAPNCIYARLCEGESEVGQ